MNILLKNIFDLIAKYHIKMTIERCGLRDGFIVSLVKNGCYRSTFISDDELATSSDDYSLYIIKGVLHELLEEEQRYFRIAEQFKKNSITINVNDVNLKG